MGKFQKGQWVRVLHTDYPKEIPVGSILPVISEDGDVHLPAPGFVDGLFFFDSEVEAWQPNVGDRVRIVASEVVAHWNELWAENEGIHLSLGDFVYVTKVTPRYIDGKSGITIGATIGGDGPRWTIDRFAPVDNATFTIEAGKFYKTRDGHKVGPIVVAQGPGKPWPWKDSRSTNYYKETGFSCPGYADGHRDADDIIAEWVDEQPAKASNDNADPASPKFNVGDRVKTKGWARFYEIAEVDDTYIWVKLYDGTTSKEYTEGREFEFEIVTPAVPTTPAIVALIENGTAKPATRPKVHADKASATTESERLALQFPGQQFGVFVLADSKIADLVNVPTAVLRAA